MKRPASLRSAPTIIHIVGTVHSHRRNYAAFARFFSNVRHHELPRRIFLDEVFIRRVLEASLNVRANLPDRGFAVAIFRAILFRCNCSDVSVTSRGAWFPTIGSTCLPKRYCRSSATRMPFRHAVQRITSSDRRGKGSRSRNWLLRTS